MNSLITEEMLSELPHRSKVKFALFCARQVEDLCKDIPEAEKAIEVTERWLAGKATGEECKEAADAAFTAYYVANAAAYVDAANATVYAVYAAANAAKAAVYAVDYATYAAANAAVYAAGNNKNAIEKAQWEYYDDLMALVDGRVDKILVGDCYE